MVFGRDIRVQAPPPVGGRVEGARQHTGRRAVHVGLGQPPVPDGRAHLDRPEIIGDGHLLVEALGHVLRRVGGPPVRHHPALEAPVAPQGPDERGIALTRVRPVDSVVSAHEGRHVRRHGGLEGRQVELPERALVDDLVHLESSRLLRVPHKVLGRGGDALRLGCPHQRPHECSPQVRVLAGEVLEGAPVPGQPEHVETGPEPHVGPLARELAGHGCPPHGHQLRVEGGGSCQGAGPRRGGARALLPLRVVRAHPLGAVLEVQRGHAQPGHRRRLPHVPAPRRAPDHPQLLVQGHPRHGPARPAGRLRPAPRRGAPRQRGPRRRGAPRPRRQRRQRQQGGGPARAEPAPPRAPGHRPAQAPRRGSLGSARMQPGPVPAPLRPAGMAAAGGVPAGAAAALLGAAGRRGGLSDADHAA